MAYRDSIKFGPVRMGPILIAVLRDNPIQFAIVQLSGMFSKAVVTAAIQRPQTNLVNAAIDVFEFLPEPARWSDRANMDEAFFPTGMQRSRMQSRLDVVTIVTAVCVAAYTAAGIGYVARYDLGFSRYQIRGAAIAIALAIATSIALFNNFGKKRRGLD